MQNDKKVIQNSEQQNSSSFQNLLQSKEQFIQKKRVTRQHYAEVFSASSRKDSEKIRYFDEQFQEVQILMPQNGTASSDAQNSGISIHTANLRHLKTSQNPSKIVKTCSKINRIWKKSAKLSSKNQYDKNMFSNITKVIIKKIVDKNSEQWVSNYCILNGFNYEDFIETLKDLNLQKIRIGTTELQRILLSSNIEPSVKRTLSNLMVDFLQNDFLSYILQEGRMHEPEKYLKCACKMMYIPQLSQEDYKRIAQLLLRELNP